MDDAPATPEVLVARGIADLGMLDYVLEDLLASTVPTGTAATASTLRKHTACLGNCVATPSWLHPPS